MASGSDIDRVVVELFSPPDRNLDLEANSEVFVGVVTTRSGTTELYTWEQTVEIEGWLALMHCVGQSNPVEGTMASCSHHDADRPTVSVQPPARRDDAETYDVTAGRLPVDAVWFVVETDTGLSIVSPVHGGTGFVQWLAELGRPVSASALAADLSQTWTFRIG